MLYEYACESCGKLFALDCKMGEAPKQAKCECGVKADRHFGNVGFVLKGGGWPSRSMKMNKEMTAKNDRAGHKMKKERGGTELKTVAHQYSDGSVKEVKS